MKGTKLSSFLSIAFLAMIVLSLTYLNAQSGSSAQTIQVTGHENHTIALVDAAALVNNYRSSIPAGGVYGEFFGHDALQRVLNQSGCIGLRIYYGKKDASTPVLVIVGVDASGADMTAGQILEYGFPCPPFCDATSALAK